MVNTLELPIRHALRTQSLDDPCSAYEHHFGALPPWMEELSSAAAGSLARQALRAGVPLAQADQVS